MGDPSSGRAVLWVTLLHGSESTCACDVKLEVRNGPKVGDLTDVRAGPQCRVLSIDRSRCGRSEPLGLLASAECIYAPEDR